MKIEKFNLKEKLEQLISVFNLDYFPSREELQKLTGMTSISNAIQRNGGYKYWASQLGLPNKAQLKRINFWTEEKAKQEIQKVIDTLNLKIFPTLHQMDKVYGNSGLSAYITKNKGVKYWAGIFNMELKNSESKTGWYGEDILEEKLKKLNYKVKKQSTLCPYDFLVDDIVRIDCKYSNVYNGSNGSFYSFSLESKTPTCDIFICICQEENKQKFLIIPHTYTIGQSQISVGINRSKWYKFENRFDYIDKYKQLYNSL